MINLRTAVLAASLLLIFASAAVADRLDEIKTRGKLVVGVSDASRSASRRE